MFADVVDGQLQVSLFSIKLLWYQLTSAVQYVTLGTLIYDVATHYLYNGARRIKPSFKATDSGIHIEQIHASTEHIPHPIIL